MVRCYLDDLGPIFGPTYLMDKVPPISLGCPLKDACRNVHALESDLEAYFIISPEFYHDVSSVVVNAMRPWRSLEGDSGVIQLTDRAWSIVQFYHPSLSGVRNKQDSTTSKRKRADAVWYMNSVPVCRVEEKEHNIGDAWVDLISKMKEWSPAVYSTQTWILAIASTLTHVKIGYFQAERDNSWRVAELCTLDMSSIDHRFIFIGIFLRFAKHLKGIADQLLNRHCKLIEAPSNCSSRHAVYLNGCHVIKEYLSQPARLDEFYQDTNAIVGIEKRVASGPISRKRERDSHTTNMFRFYYELIPVGLDVLSSDFPAAIPSLIATVRKLHEVGWAHLDIRWSNIIYEPIGQKYVLIDCEFARKFGDNLPQQTLKCLEALPHIPPKVCPEIDWFSLGKMILMIDPPSSQLQMYADAFLSMDMKKINLVFE